MRTPFYRNETSRFLKSTYITESVYLQFRSEFYNISPKPIF